MRKRQYSWTTMTSHCLYSVTSPALHLNTAGRSVSNQTHTHAYNIDFALLENWFLNWTLCLFSHYLCSFFRLHYSLSLSSLPFLIHVSIFVPLVGLQNCQSSGCPALSAAATLRPQSRETSIQYGYGWCDNLLHQLGQRNPGKLSLLPVESCL